MGDFDPDEILARLDTTELVPRAEQLARLSAQAHEAADWVVEQNVEAVEASLRFDPPDEPPCSLCLMPMHDSTQVETEEAMGREIYPLDVEVLAIDTHAERRARVGRSDPVVDAWLGIEWSDVRYLDVRSPDLLAREDAIAAEAFKLVGRVPVSDETAEIEWHHWWWGWIFERVVRRLNEVPPVAVAADFVAYYQDGDFGPWPPTIIRHVGTESALGLLDEQQLLPSA